MRLRSTRVVGLVVAFALLGAACGGKKTTTAGTEGPAAKPSADTAAAGLRSDLNRLLQEHVYLAASATGAALRGDTPGFNAAAAALDGNSDDIINTFGSVYPEAKGTFNDAWKGHIGFVVSYTSGLAAKDTAKSDKAVQDLQGYADSFGQFLADTVEPLPDGATVSDLLLHHILTLKDVIDAQAEGDPAAAFTALRIAADHMHMLGDPLAAAIVAQHPESFTD